MPSLEVLEECQSTKCLHLQHLMNVRTPNAFPCNIRGMSERQKPSFAAFEEGHSAKCLHLKRLRNVKVPNAFRVSAKQIAARNSTRKSRKLSEMRVSAAKSGR
eukprot:384371-Amphidinium_carterae.1